jgi:hypothetical protein
MSEPAKHAVDALAVGTLIASLLSWLPGITALMVLVWTVLRIFESVQQIRLNNRKLREK